ncbi:MAG TPA: threonine-phosphate decarboxylase CobD [Paraburkholderia sp.]|jgi:cobalamin biosynthetic protein CobC
MSGSPVAHDIAAVMHGGNLHEAARRYGIDYDAWIDLSTGINPHGYPVPPLPASAWRRLPDDGDGFAAAAARYYGVDDARCVLPVAGSQAAIRALPLLLPAARTAIASLTYGEYLRAFVRAAHPVVPLEPAWDAIPDGIVHAVVVTPNNPTTARIAPSRLLQWHAQLLARRGTLIVDETFADALPDAAQASVAVHAGREGLVVLRSPGKFFGLAGARCGFVLGHPALLDTLRDELGPWTVSGPARHAVLHAFADSAWQREMRVRLANESARLAALLREHGLEPHATPLFAWVVDSRAAMLQHALAQQGIWTRWFAEPTSLRFGLPDSEAAWQRLAYALSAWARKLI